MQAPIQYGAFLVILALLVKPFGRYITRFFQGQKTFLDPELRPVVRILYRVAAVDPQQEMDWKQYAVSLVLFGFCETLVLYGILRLGQFLPCPPSRTERSRSSRIDLLDRHLGSGWGTAPGR